MTGREREYVRLGCPAKTDGSMGQPWELVMRARALWAVGIGRLISDTAWMFYVFWLAKFLVDSQGLSIAEMGRIGWIPFLFADWAALEAVGFPAG